MLNLALISLRQLIADNEFIAADDIETVQHDYDLNSSTVAGFVQRRCEITKDEEDYIICRDLYDAYTDYCKVNEQTVKSDNIFGSELAQKHVKKDRTMVKGTQEYVYVGIRLVG